VADFGQYLNPGDGLFPSTVAYLNSALAYFDFVRTKGEGSVPLTGVDVGRCQKAVQLLLGQRPSPSCPNDDLKIADAASQPVDSGDDQHIAFA
jgi:hypothetical protein